MRIFAVYGHLHSNGRCVGGYLEKQTSLVIISPALRTSFSFVTRCYLITLAGVVKSGRVGT